MSQANLLRGYLAKLPRGRLTSALLFCFGIFCVTATAAAEEFSAKQKTEIEGIFRDYLLKNPEILRKTVNELERREKAAELDARSKIISDPSSVLYTSPHQSVIGNPNGKVTLIEFFDYNCPYCRSAVSDIARLVKENPDLRVILRDLPILSKGSLEAAQIEGAVRLQLSGEKFWDFHEKLLGLHGAVGRAQALAIAKGVGADMAQVEKDAATPSVKDGIDETDKLGQALAITGTPTFLVGDEVVVGAVGYDALKGKLENVRKCGKTACS
jgi:protein-disulfide isomerase